MSTPETTYKIPAERLSKLQAGVDKLNRRATKLGMGHVGFVASAPRAEFHSGMDAHLPDDLRKQTWVIDITFTGAAPRIKGFAFAAKLDHQTGTLINNGTIPENCLHGIWLWAQQSSDEAERRHMWAGGWYAKPEAMQQAVGQ